MPDPNHKKFGVLIHGAGWVAGQHAAAFKNNPSAEVVAVSSRRLTSAEEVADIHLHLLAALIERRLAHPDQAAVGLRFRRPHFQHFGFDI